MGKLNRLDITPETHKSLKMYTAEFGGTMRDNCAKAVDMLIASKKQVSDLPPDSSKKQVSDLPPESTKQVTPSVSHETIAPPPPDKPVEKKMTPGDVAAIMGTEPEGNYLAGDIDIEDIA